MKSSYKQFRNVTNEAAGTGTTSRLSGKRRHVREQVENPRRCTTRYPEQHRVSIPPNGGISLQITRCDQAVRHLGPGGKMTGNFPVLSLLCGSRTLPRQGPHAYLSHQIHEKSEASLETDGGGVAARHHSHFHRRRGDRLHLHQAGVPGDHPDLQGRPAAHGPASPPTFSIPTTSSSRSTSRTSSGPSTWNSRRWSTWRPTWWRSSITQYRTGQISLKVRQGRGPQGSAKGECRRDGLPLCHDHQGRPDGPYRPGGREHLQ